MPEIQRIAVAELLLDLGNARLLADPTSQQETAQELAKQQQDKLVNLAEDIVRRGMDPLSLTAVVPMDGGRDGYLVLEGNRRVLALQALDTPELVGPVLSRALARRLDRASEAFAARPIDEINCVVFDHDDEEAHQWVRLRHRGEQRGVGVVPWDADEANKYDARHGAPRNPAGQVIDFIERHGTLSDAARESRHGIITNVERLLRNSEERRRLGLDVQGQRVVALKDRDWVARIWSAVIEDLKTRVVRVGTLYNAPSQERYVRRLLRRVGAPPRRSLASPTPIEDWTSGRTSGEVPPPRPRPRRTPARRTVVPKGRYLFIENPRVARIYRELRSLDTERFPNASSVLFRVFIELSADELLLADSVLPEARVNNDPLVARVKAAAEHLHREGAINGRVKRAVASVIDRQRSPIAASAATFNLYVHNPYVHPRAEELHTTWDELEPFIDALWSRIGNSLADEQAA